MSFPSKMCSESAQLNICRCCLKEDGFTDIFTHYPDSYEKETCEEMLKSTFNIQAMKSIGSGRKVPKGASAPGAVVIYESVPVAPIFCTELSPLLTNSKICERCITSVREARAFKLKVLQSQETLSEDLQSLDQAIKLPDQDLRESIKTEERDDVFSRSCEECAYDSPDDNETLANLKHGHSSSEEAVTGKRRKCKLKRNLKSKRCKIKENNGKVTNEIPEKDWSKISERRGKGPLLRDNSLKLIQNSNLCVFQWNKSQYRCFCCNIPFTDISTLKQHTFKEHTLENIEKKIISQQNRLVKVEISNLECKLCREKLDDVSILKQHLSSTHSIGISDDLLVPFRIGDVLKCQICYETFSVFRLLNIHINRHFQRQVCHICGAGFSNLVFLNLHKTRSHRTFFCKACDLTLNSRSEKKHHEITLHGVKYERKLRFPCPFCPERFFQENFKVRHLVESHGMVKPEFKCGVCSKTFITRSLCNNHVKNVHNKEKNQECDVCHNFFYTKSDVTRHKVTHSGEKKYSCEMCCNPFATRDSLRRHMKRTHVGVN